MNQKNCNYTMLSRNANRLRMTIAEDQIYEKLMRRREAYRLYGLRVRPCSEFDKYI